MTRAIYTDTGKREEKHRCHYCGAAHEVWQALYFPLWQSYSIIPLCGPCATPEALADKQDETEH